MYAKVTLRSVRAESPLLVPGDALVARANGIRVAVVGDDGVVHFQKVSVSCECGAFQVV